MMTITAPDIIAGLWRANIVLFPVLTAILAVRGSLRRHCGSDAVYWLWLIVPVIMITAALPPRGMIEQAAWATPWIAPPHIALPNLRLIEIWVGGASLSLILLAIAHVRVLWKAKQGQIGPAVIGFVAPRIYLPADFEARFTPSEQAVIRAHERAHMNRKDTLANGCVAMLQILFWFNPAALLGARLFREDQEMACDQTVMDLNPERRRLYAETMLKSQTVHWSPSLGCAFGRHPLEHRIAALGLEPSTRRMVTIRLVLVSAVTVLVFQLGQVYFPPAEGNRPLAEPLLIDMHQSRAEAATRFTPETAPRPHRVHARPAAKPTAAAPASTPQAPDTAA
jgi:beta-lactamase regulating signal transducer with metallopeptidase domain